MKDKDGLIVKCHQAVVSSYGRVRLRHQHHPVKELVVGKKNSGGLRDQ